MPIKHDEESFKIHLNAKYLAERAHRVAILESHGQDTKHDKARLIKEYREFRESLFKAGWI